ncbi:MAG: SAM-dependent methyltransferase [Vulcanimicrobiota bacterium]
MYLCSADPDSWDHLEHELQDRLIERLDERSGLCRLEPEFRSFFLQHRFPVTFQAVLPSASFESVSTLKLELPCDLHSTFSFQISANKRLDLGFGSLIPGWMESMGLPPELRSDRQADRVYSVHLQCEDQVRLFAGSSRPQDNLSPWSRGVCRIPRAKDAVSRAESKLEEALELLPELPVGRALDLGAAPGGWTRVLWGRGFEVVAVDPAELSPPVAALSRVAHHRTTAGEFLARDESRYDLIVSDMKMDPGLLSALLARYQERLEPGGFLLATLKLPKRGNPLPLLDHALEKISRAYTVVQARQLYFNRHEVTVVATSRG